MPESSKKLEDVVGRIFSDVEKSALERIKSGDRNEEDHITTTVFTLAEEKINDGEFNNLQLRARQFPGRGPNYDESITGADGAIILDAKFKDTEFRKYYLFQAKKFSTNSKFNEHAIDQKHKMLVWCPDSFFLIYTQTKFCFVSAFLVGLNNKLNELPTKSFVEFHKDFFGCFIGDHSLRFPWPPFSRHWPWDFWDEFKGVTKFNEKSPLAKQNLLIEISPKG